MSYVIIWFAMGYWYEGDILHTAKFYSHDRAACEARFDRCFEGRVQIPVRRPSSVSPTR